MTSKYYFIESNGFCGYYKIACEYSFSASEGKKWIRETYPNAKVKLVKKKNIANLEMMNKIKSLMKEI